MADPEEAVVSTKGAWAYVGGRAFFEELLTAYPEIIRPIRQTRSGASRLTKTQYLKTVLDTALKAAQLSQAFVAK